MALQNLTEATFDEAVKQAPLAIVDVWATWCGPCKMMGPVVDKLAEDYDGKVLVGKVDADEEMDLVQRFGIASITTLIIFKNGEAAVTSVGALSQAGLEAKINEVL